MSDHRRSQPVLLTEASMAAAREHFAKLSEECAAAAQRGEFYVNDIPQYVRDQHKSAAEHRAGKWDHTFTNRQWAHYVQTGKMVPLFSS